MVQGTFNWSHGGIDGRQWREYALAQCANELDGHALTLGEQDPRVLAAREAWRRGDINDLANILAAIRGG